MLEEIISWSGLERGPEVRSQPPKPATQSKVDADRHSRPHFVIDLCAAQIVFSSGQLGGSRRPPLERFICAKMVKYLPGEVANGPKTHTQAPSSPVAPGVLMLGQVDRWQRARRNPSSVRIGHLPAPTCGQLFIASDRRHLPGPLRARGLRRAALARLAYCAHGPLFKHPLDSALRPSNSDHANSRRKVAQFRFELSAENDSEWNRLEAERRNVGTTASIKRASK